MRPVIWKDENGQAHRSLVRDTDEDSMAPYGLPAEAPNLDWDAIRHDVEGILNEHRLLTWSDVMKDRTGLEAALNAFKKHVISRYKNGG